jgi:hypothetical protein
VLVSALALAAGLVGSTARAALPTDFVGVVADDVWGSTDASYRFSSLAQMQGLGVHLIRMTFDWALIEKTPGVYDFAFYDDFIQAAANDGIEVLPVLFDPPKFRSSRPKRHARRGTYYPKHFADMGAFGAAVAARYGPGGTFWQNNPVQAPIQAIQIWNEPNLPVYDPKGPSPKRYAALLKAAYKPIKAANPNVAVTTAGLPDSHLSKPVNVFKWIDQLYRAGGAKGFDVLAVNPYATTTRQLLGKLKKVRKIMAKHHDSASQIWVTEMGWSDRGPPSSFRVGASGQASRIRTAIPALAKAQASLKLRGFIYYSWHDGKKYAGLRRDFWGLHTGLLRINGTEKPAYQAFQQAVAGLPH